MKIIERPRRLRQSASIRDLVEEHTLSARDLIWPVFIKEGKHLREPISALSGCDRVSVDELLAHHEQRLDEVERRVVAGAGTAAEVAAAMSWTRRETPLDELDVVQRMLAVLETDAHLEVLAVQGRVRREIDREHGDVARHDVA